MGPTANQITTDNYKSFHDATGENYDGENLQSLVGQTMTMNITGTDVCYDVENQTWTSRKDGAGFSYTRTEAELNTFS